VSLPYTFIIRLLQQEITKMHCLFVHGSLRRGCRDNGLISAGTFLNRAETAKHSALCPVNEKPPVVKRPVSVIKGEVYSVTDEMLTVVKRIMGQKRINQRELVPVRFEDGQTVDAWLYFYIQPLHSYTLIESGEYVELKK